MQVLFIIFLVIFSLACILIRSWVFNTIYKSWLDFIFLEYKNKDKENQLTHNSVEVEVKKKEDEL